MRLAYVVRMAGAHDVVPPATMDMNLASCSALLVIEDDGDVRRSIRLVLRRLATGIEECADGRSGIARALDSPPCAVLLDLGLPDMSGFEVLATLRCALPQTPVIVVSGNDSVDAAVDAMRQGAIDFITKPFVSERLITTVRNALRVSRLDRRIGELERALSRQDGSPQPQTVRRVAGTGSLAEELRALATGTASVLLQGPCGVGKSLIARALHDWGPRARQCYVEVNCAELAAEQLAAVLTDAGPAGNPAGDAGAGSLFLNCIDALDDPAQVRLLAVLEREAHEPHDPKRPRLIAASSADLAQQVALGRFRTDLFHRLQDCTLTVRPLRDLRNDIPDLAYALLCQLRGAENGAHSSIEPAAAAKLQAYGWPGNLRELERVIGRAAAATDETVLTAAAIEAAMKEHVARAHAGETHSFGDDGQLLPLREVERRHLEAALVACAGNLSETARMLGIGRTTLYRKIAKYGLLNLSGA